MFVNILISLCYYFFSIGNQVKLDPFRLDCIGLIFFSLKSCNYRFLFLESSSSMLILIRSFQ